MRLAVHGILADGVGSGAGVFPVLLGELLRRGHSIDLFGIRGFTEPRSLERFSTYRFLPLPVPFLQRVGRAVGKVRTTYTSALASQLWHLGYQRQAVLSIEKEHARTPYDLIVCTDAQALWPSSLPVLCWPQSPPHTEGSALRHRDVARAVVSNDGLAHFAAVQVFYAYRSVVARAALGSTDLFVCGSRWAESEWRRFGADPNRLRTLAYPIDLEPFATTPAPGSNPENVTFLWLGRAVPRKRLDLFLSAFERLHERHPTARARLVGNLSDDPFARRLLERYAAHPAVRVERQRPRADIPTVFAEADVLVQPSQHENFGFSVAEALAAGRAVVLGPTNGTADYVGDAGYVFSDYQAESVAEAMERAFHAVTHDGRAVSVAARAAANAHFGLENVATRFDTLCSEAFADRSRTA
jgi:glycosyltransferase involved in cell wall biosynthesis